MNIKRLSLFVIVMALSLGLLSSCSSFRSDVFNRDDDKIAETRLQKIIESLETKDKDALKNMFSTNAVKEAKDLDGSIEYIMDFYKGKVISKEGSFESADSKDDGVIKSELKGFYRVATENDKYIIFFIDQLGDNKNADNVGLYMLQVIKLADKEKYFDFGEKTKCAGIYRPDTVK